MNFYLFLSIIIISSLIVLVCFISYMFFNIALKSKPRRKNTNFPPNSARAKYSHKFIEFRQWYAKQDVKIEQTKSFDGLNLYTQILEKENSKKVVIMMHGFRAQDHDDFSGSVKFFYDDGFTILLPHQRAHERSEGKHLTFGAKESLDCKKWVEFAIQKFGEDTQVVLYGVSMGCATVILSLNKNLPTNVKCCIADCGYTDAKSIFKHILGHSYYLPVFPIVNLLEIVCDKIAGFKFIDSSPNEVLKTNKTPILFIHGKRDRFVPYKMTLKNYEACVAEKELLIIDNATHAISFLVEPKKCWDTTRNFVYKYFANNIVGGD